jgi:alpha-N-arabinofuranosidase
MKHISRLSLLFVFIAVGFGLGAVLRLEAIRPDGAPQTGQAAAAAPGIVANGSFEEMDGKLPRGWRVSNRTPIFSVDTAARAGKASVKITSAEGADAWWYAVVPVKPYARYRLSGWIKTENVEAGTGRGALFNLHGLGGMETPAVTGTRDWARVELVFDSTGNDAVQVNCLLGGWGRSKGTAWYDDVQLEELSVRTLEPAVTIRQGATRAPMSKYIYGQFIEHLGRCIYGGIWAEMLEDRKFFYSVGDKESPWKPVGNAAAITMNSAAPYVGAHTPDITLAGDGTPGGIEQGDLGVTAGKKYVGRVILAGDAGAGPVQVSLVWGAGEKDRQTVTILSVSRDFHPFPLAFAAGATTDTARLVISATGKSLLRVGTASLMPADNVEGFRADTLQLLGELNSPVYRWPGGNFVSGYDWRDGIGDRDKRPPRKNPAWRGVEHNDVGIDEFMALCRLLGTESYIAVNSGLGDVQSAADEVEYVNGAAATPQGAVRAKNGHQAPYACRFWSIGNEMYGNWQLGHMPLAQYQEKHNQFARAMRAKDPSITLVGVGDVGAWTEGMLTNCADNMGLISEHFYVQEAPGLMGHVALVPRQIKRIAEAHRKYRQTVPQLAGKDIQIALDEWNYWYGPHLYGELGTQYFLKDALGIVAGLHEYSRQSDIVFMANYAQTVNVIGAIKTSKREAVLDSTGVVLALYRRQFGTIPVEIGGAPEPLDVAAAWRENGKALTISVVNPTRQEQTIDLQLDGRTLPATARLWRVGGTDEKACNVPGKPPRVVVQETAAAPIARRLTVPAMSASLYELTMTR